MPELSVEQIERNFAEIAAPLNRAEALHEANRCLYCFDAPCTRACPTHIDVPAFIKKIASGNLAGAARVIFDANPVGATCARVCPVEELCEGACVEKTLVKKPIAIGRLQRYATDYAMQSGRAIYEPGAPNGKSIGVVGSGPAGLSCAAYLARLGYAVTVYEKKPLPGGLDTYGMAEYKMMQRDSLAEVEAIKNLGVEFRLNTPIVSELEDQKPKTRDQILFTDFQSAHDAVFLAVGLGATNDLGIEGEDLPGVVDALRFIEAVKTRDWRRVSVAETVAVIGAGNTAIDAATQAKRLGARKVSMIYRRTERDISAYPYEYELAKKDGIEFVWQTAPTSVLKGENGAVAALRCEKTDGSREAFDIPCEMVVKAIGQTKRGEFFRSVGVATDEKGRVTVNEMMQTSNPKIFAGGDSVNGGAEAVDAAQTGKLAARGIHFSLSGERVSFAGAA